MFSSQRPFWIVLGVLQALLSPLSGVTVRDAPTQEERDAIKAAALAIGEELASVAYAIGYYEETPYVGGSVVVLNRTTAISAAHASFYNDGGGGQFEYDQIQIGFGNMFTTFENEGPFHTVTSLHRHAVHDLVIYDFSDDPLPEDVATATIHDGNVDVRELVHFAGYGLFSHERGETVRDGNKYGFRGIVKNYTDNRFPSTLVYTLFTRMPANDDYHVEGGLGDDGDIGGGVFLQVSDNSYELVGIMEVVTGHNIYGSHTGFLPLPLPDVRAFIEPFLEETPVVVENPEGDDVNDGQNNLVEFAFGSDPKSSSSQPQFEQAFRGAGEEETMLVSYLRRTDGLVLYEGEASRDLRIWFPATPCDPPGEGLAIATAGYEWASFCVGRGIQKGYIRVRVRLAADVGGG